MVVDSSVWIEILREGPLHAKCLKALQSEKVRVPSLVLFEVYRKLKAKVSEDAALEAIAALGAKEVLELTREVALLAADLSLEHGLGTADALVLAHAAHLREPLLTLDHDFSGLPNVKLIQR